MIAKQLSEIRYEDLEKLIENSVLERKTLEYKSELKYSSDLERKEFLADISSFANASGGDLIFGIKATDGIPVEIEGLKIINIDSEILRLESIIRDGIEPRISVSTQTINIPNGNVTLIFRIKKSWFGPHRVIFKGHDKFYARNSAGKFALDTSELRNAFTLSPTLTETISNFKTSRIMDLYADNTPIPLFEGGKIILHLIPFESFNLDNSKDINQLNNMYQKMEPMRAGGAWDKKINLEGILAYSGSSDKKSLSYVELYRNGIIEAVVGLTANFSQNEKKKLPGEAYETILIHAVSKYLNILKDLSINPPIVMFITFIEVKGYKITSANIMFDDENHVIDRDILNLPETIIETYDVSPTKILKPIFDLVWNACGHERSLNFNEKGDWIRK